MITYRQYLRYSIEDQLVVKITATSTTKPAPDMNPGFLLISAMALAIASYWSHVDHHQPNPAPGATNSSALGRQDEKYKVTFKVPAHTRIEGDLEVAIQNEKGLDTLIVPAEIQVYNTFTKHTMTISMCLPHQTMVRKSTFEIGESPQPKQLIVTFSKLPGQSTCEAYGLTDSLRARLPDSLRVKMSRYQYKTISTCRLVGLPEKRVLLIPTTHNYVETSVQAECMGSSVSTKRPVSSSIKVSVRFRKHPLDD